MVLSIILDLSDNLYVIFSWLFFFSHAGLGAKIVGFGTSSMVDGDACYFRSFDGSFISICMFT